MIEYFPIKFDKGSFLRYEKLFSVCFPNSEKFSPIYLKWLYEDNPDGCAIGFDAYEDNCLVAHYACIPTRINLNGKIEKSLLSLNTATHPNYQGKGLFVKLAAMTYESAASLGYGSVYGVANASSTPGFIKKLGFQLIGGLEAKIGFGNLNINEKKIRNALFFRVWNEESLQWRCSNPINPIRAREKFKKIFFQGTVNNKLISIISELPKEKIFLRTPKFKFFPLRLFLGLTPPDGGEMILYINIPKIFRPSPLNLIFLSLRNQPISFCKSRIFFTFLDFDAY